MDASPRSVRTSVSGKVAIIAVTATLYAIGKGLTAYVPSPWGVGSLLVGIFLPAYLAVVSETLPVAIGAAMGTFVGDVLFLTPLGTTNPALSLIAGVPANFFAFLLFGWFVKRYKTWSGFVAGTVAFVTLGNLIAATSVVLFGALVFAPAAGLASFNGVNLVLGFTVFWNTTSIPAIIIAVPILIRATRPLFGRSQILKFDPHWSARPSGMQLGISIVFALLFLILGVVFLLGFYSSVSPIWGQLDFYVPVAALLVLVFAPLVSVIAGSGRKATQAAA
ncbi:MAG: hypothetical protein JRN08_06370 [Nitrososphaerota archaeon]|nr:hypothetical protein [Nitrososphaerota archaeon]